MPARRARELQVREEVAVRCCVSLALSLVLGSCIARLSSGGGAGLGELLKLREEGDDRVIREIGGCKEGLG